jgi:tRNA dimethylallyltransferase
MPSRRDRTPAAVRTILIAGPTASGKSALALALAERLDGIVVNADAMQVYRDLRILTARPSAAEEARVPHRLFGHVDAAESYSVGRWLDDIRSLLHPAGESDAAPMLIFVGGTGLYLEALTRGIAGVPSIPEDIRAKWRALAAHEPSEALHAALASRDPVMAARLRPSDPQRILRALEVQEATGRSLAAWQAESGPPLIDAGTAVRLVLTPARPALRARIAGRFAAMIDSGALAEVAALAARRLEPDLPAMKALGVGPLAAHLRGEIGLDAAIQRAVIDSGRYAKRQETWLRNRMVDWSRATPDEAETAVLAALGRG